MAERKPKAARRTTAPVKQTTTRKPAATPRARRPQRSEVTHEQIARRAYELHVEGHGDAYANWLRAEKELTTT